MVVMVPSLLLMSFTPWMTRHIPIRIAISCGLALSVGAAWLETNLTAQSTGGDFIISQLIRGVGTLVCLVYLSQAAIMSLPRADAGDGAGLFNVARNLGGSVALAAVAVMEDQRRWLHTRRIEEMVSANAVSVQDHIAQTAQQFGGTPAALRVLGNEIFRQAMVMTYDDLFWLLAVSTAVVIPLTIFLKPLPQAVTRPAMH
jgi:DHA2 family multidrug resistance protein